jgi:uncharacterized protein
MEIGTRLKVAVVGTGISGLSAAWLLSQRHNVTVYERAHRIGGHSNTVSLSLDGCSVPVDTGFMVFNRCTYPNLAALLDLLDVRTRKSDMSFAVSLNDGAIEYSSNGVRGLFGQRRNLLRPQFWSMLADTLRFYRQAPRDACGFAREHISLGDYLAEGRYASAFRDHHILPMASAIWSAAPRDILSFPAACFIRFYENHGLLRLRERPIWETVEAGSRVYVERLTRAFADRIRRNTAVVAVRRGERGVLVTDSDGHTEPFDHIVMATHANEALAALADPSRAERQLLGAFRYSRNLAVLHTDRGLMPKRRAVWASWNFIASRPGMHEGPCITYWMNNLQQLKTERQIFVTLNPPRPPRHDTLHDVETYNHPVFDAQAISAQRNLWQLQGVRNTWFCGAYFGAGFHEDGLQAGLAVAEQLGGVRRPWSVQNESGRIAQTAPELAQRQTELAA